MQLTLLKNCHIVDGTSPEKGDLIDVIIENERIKELGTNLSSSSAEVIDLKGRTLMPGLIVVIGGIFFVSSPLQLQEVWGHFSLLLLLFLRATTVLPY